MVETNSRWTVAEAKEWHCRQPWIVGCNFLPGSAINQLEMWQAETYDPVAIEKELSWAESLGFNALRVYLHDLVWASDAEGFMKRIDDFLALAQRKGMKVLLVLFDDCHRPDPRLGPQPKPLPGIHNSGWKHSPGQELVRQFHDGTVAASEKERLAAYVHGVISRFADDRRVLMWDLYNEPGQSNNGDRSNELLRATWQWAQEVRPSQPLTSCLEGSVGERNIALNLAQSDVISFHCYQGDRLEQLIHSYQHESAGRPVICTEYMARELGTTFQHSLPIFKKYRTGCFNWGLVAGKSQTHFNWQTVKAIDAVEQSGAVLLPGEPIPEPELWFHDIFRMDGTPFDQREVDFIREITKASETCVKN